MIARTSMDAVQRDDANAFPIGIDLGTTISVLAYFDGEQAIAHNASPTPSAVFLGDAVIVGRQALELGLTAPSDLAETFKREMGKSHFHRKLRNQDVPPEVLSGFVVEQLKEDAVSSLGPIRDAVIAVPAYFDEIRRRATQDAARLAGINVLDIINEPVAAAIAYGFQQHDADGDSRAVRILVYDFGGGTFDVSILEIEGQQFRTVATDGDLDLGGRDLDERLVDYIAEQFFERHGVDPRSDPIDTQRLWKLAQDTKHALSEQETYIATCQHAGLRMAVEVTRDTFQQLIEPLVDRTLNTCANALREANLNWGDIDRLLLVGGSTRIPLIQSKIRQLTRIEPTKPQSPEELIAQGAALYAASITDNAQLREFKVINVNAHSLGIAGVDVQTNQSVNKVLIPRNTPLPTSATCRFVTRRQDQRNVSVPVLEGESKTPAYCTRLGKCVVQLEPGLPKGTEVEVTCHYLAGGTISVSARVPLTRRSARVEIKREGTNQLDPLDVWRRRLTTGEEPMAALRALSKLAESNQQLERSDDSRRLTERLDHLYGRIGLLSSDSAVPAAALSSQRGLCDATRELEFIRRLLLRLNRAHETATNASQRAQLSAFKCNVRMHLSHAESWATHASIVLGRECVVSGFCPPETTDNVEEIRQLQTLLVAESN